MLAISLLTLGAVTMANYLLILRILPIEHSNKNNTNEDINQDDVYVTNPPTTTTTMVTTTASSSTTNENDDERKITNQFLTPTPTNAPLVSTPEEIINPDSLSNPDTERTTKSEQRKKEEKADGKEEEDEKEEAEENFSVNEKKTTEKASKTTNTEKKIDGNDNLKQIQKSSIPEQTNIKQITTTTNTAQQQQTNTAQQQTNIAQQHVVEEQQQQQPLVYLTEPRAVLSDEELIRSFPKSWLKYSTEEYFIKSQRYADYLAEEVRQEMVHCWRGYSQMAWGKDEVRPMHGAGVNNWGGLGITLIDALDTLYLMGLKDEFFFFLKLYKLFNYKF